MPSSSSSKSIRTSRGFIVAAAIGALVLTGIVTVGCTTTASNDKATTPATTSQPAAKPSMPATVTTASDVQTCLTCDKKKMPAKTVGAAVVANGVQVVNIAIEGGTYVPNTITVKAGMPVKVVFTGKAKGCLAKPTFKSLKMQVNLMSTASGTLDLGSLKPGTYKFTCGMGMNAGTITAS